LDKIWISDGKTNDRARVELRVEFEETDDETTGSTGMALR
jgi:hypothetical protein